MSDILSNVLKDFTNPSSITDLHFSVEQPPTARTNGFLTALQKIPPQTVPMVVGALKHF